MDRLIPQPLLDVLVIPVEHSLIGWMLVGGVAEVSSDVLHSSFSFSLPPSHSLIPNECAKLLATTSLTTYQLLAGWQWDGRFSHCPGAPFAGTLVFNLAWWMTFNTAVYLWFYRRARDGWRVSLAWLNMFT